MTERELLVYCFQGDMNAVLMLESIARITQVWDDLIDKDAPVSDEAINRCWRDALTGIPRNPFWRAHVQELLPLIDAFITDWHSSNVLKKGSELEKMTAYVIRDSLNILTIHCAALIGGHEWAEKIAVDVRRHVHDENFDDYCRSLSDEQ